MYIQDTSLVLLYAISCKSADIKINVKARWAHESLVHIPNNNIYSTSRKFVVF